MYVLVQNVLYCEYTSTAKQVLTLYLLERFCKNFFILQLKSKINYYSGLSLSRLPSISNTSPSRTKCSVPWNFPQEHCIAFLYSELLYLELFLISNKLSGPLNHFLSLSRTFTYSNFIFEFPNKFEFESKQKFRP